MEPLTSYLGREIPKNYLDFLEKHDGDCQWLTRYPNTEHTFSEQIDLWSKELFYRKSEQKR